MATSPKHKWWFLIPLFLIVPVWAIAQQTPPALKVFAPGVISLMDMNGNFANVDTRLKALEVPALPTAAIYIDSAHCMPQVSGGVTQQTDCYCTSTTSADLAISGGAWSGPNGATPFNSMFASQASGVNFWRVACVTPGGLSRTACLDPFAVCLKRK